MTKPKYKIIDVKKPEHEPRSLLVVPHKDGKLTVGYPAFGPNIYQRNIQQMNKTYSHPQNENPITFRPATITESISAAIYGFENEARPNRFYQAGYIVKTQDGVFTNTTETNEKNLKKLLNGVKKANGIYLMDNDVAFAPYESFETSFQDRDTFTRGGLARALEHTNKKIAKNLNKIASSKLSEKTVHVNGFDKSKKPVLRVICLDSYWGLGGFRLYVLDDNWDGGDGRAFGVLKE